MARGRATCYSQADGDVCMKRGPVLHSGLGRDDLRRPTSTAIVDCPKHGPQRVVTRNEGPSGKRYVPRAD